MTGRIRKRVTRLSRISDLSFRLANRVIRRDLTCELRLFETVNDFDVLYVRENEEHDQGAFQVSGSSVVPCALLTFTFLFYKPERLLCDPHDIRDAECGAFLA